MADLTPEDRDQIQMHWLRRWIAQKVKLHGRRKDDLPMTTSKLSRSQMDQYWRWLVERRKDKTKDDGQ